MKTKTLALANKLSDLSSKIMKDPRTRNSLGFALVAVVAAVAFSMAQPADRTGTLTAPLSIPMMMDGKQIGSSTAPAGTKVKILQEEAGKTLVATAAGQAWTTGVTVDEPAKVEEVNTTVDQLSKPTPTPTPKPKRSAKDMLGSELMVGIVNVERKASGAYTAAVLGGWLVKTAKKSEKQPFQISFIANHWLTDIAFDAEAEGVKIAGYPKAEEDIQKGQIQDIDLACQTGIHVYIYIGNSLYHWDSSVLEKIKRGDFVFIPRSYASWSIDNKELQALLPKLPHRESEEKYEFYRKDNVIVYDEAIDLERSRRQGRETAVEVDSSRHLSNRLGGGDANFKKFLEEMIAMIPALYAERVE